MNMQTGMVVVLEKGFESSMQFMEQVRLTGIEHNLEGWWWCSDKGLIRDPSESNEMLVKAQTMYDALRGKPIYVNGVRIFQAHSRADIMKMLDVCQHDVLNLPEPKISVAAIDLNDPEGGGLLSEDMEKTTEFPEIRLGGHTVEEVFSFDNKQTHTTTQELINGKTVIQDNSEAVELHRKLDIFGLKEDNSVVIYKEPVKTPDQYFSLKLLIVAILVIAALFIFTK